MNRASTEHLDAGGGQRRRFVLLATLLVVTVWMVGAPLPARAGSTPPAVQTTDGARIIALAQEAMVAHGLRSVIVRVTVDDAEVVTAALGESITGVPATTGMHFRNGAVAIAYIATLLLQFVDDGRIGLDDPIRRWLPELPDADRVTFRMLANMTAGYPDYVQNPRLVADIYADPFRQWTPDELIAIGLSTPRVFAPGTNWDYSHTNYVILGKALERVGGQPMMVLMQERILGPLGLTGTTGSATAAIPAPVLHAFSSERREALGIPSGTRFYEESTYWNPSWTLAEGAIQTTTITDLTTTARAIGEGILLSAASHQEQVAPRLLGFGAPLAGCPNCHRLDERYTYGLGIVRSGSWLLQNPLFAGYGAVAAYLPGRKIAIAVAVTFGEQSFDAQGNVPNYSDDLFRAIGALLAPDDPPPPGRR
jgi:CubicO group peptidase (beta-lactamase class C family)